MKVLNNLFSNLSSYFYKENDLSDVTVSMINSVPSFRSFFMNYFFGDRIAIEHISDVLREIPSEDGESRVDIYIEMDNEAMPFLIEVKIGDESHHFGQYEKSYNIPSGKLGYIVNYKFSKEGYDVKQWANLYKALTNYAETISNDDEKQVILGYLEYVKNVCGINNFEGIMNIKGIYSMYGFLSTIDALCNREEEKFTLKRYRTNKGNAIGVERIYFQLTYTNNIIKDVWGFVGLWYDRSEPSLCIGFCNQNGWGKNIYDILDANRDKLYQGEYFNKPYNEDGTYFFEANFLQKFDNAESLDEQVSLLRNFMDKVIEYPLGLI